VGFLGSFLISKKLNLLVLPDKDAAMLGLKIKPLRYLVIGITALLSGVVTAFCGPIAFHFLKDLGI
jgi:iron complex transport system permease protein